MPGTTTNRANRYPAGGDAANVPQDIQNLATDLDNVANIYTGTLAGRPAASAAAGHGAGNAGSFYYATDTGELFVSIAGAWIKVTTEPGIPLGAQIPYGGSGDPADTRFLLADGRALARAGQYAPLFAVISTTYGVGDGSTTFNLPDKRGRVSVGADNMGTAAGAGNRLTTTLKARGQVNGEEFHLLTSDETGVRDHQHGSHSHIPSATIDGGSSWTVSGDTAAGNTGGVITGSTPALTAHNTVQPGQVDNMLVRVK